MKISIPCVVFAGGKSKRMGEDKALLPFGNFNSLALYQQERLKPYFQKVYISCKDKKKFGFEGDFIEDLKDFQEYSPLVALVSVFEKIEDKYIFVLSVDSPFFEIDDFYRLYENIKDDFDAIVSKYKNAVHPLCSIYSRDILFRAKELLQNNRHKLKDLLKESKTKYVDFENEQSFMNLNYKEDYKNAQRILK